MQNASVIAECAKDDFFWEIYSRKGGLFEQDPPERDALLSAAEILADDGKFEALSRLRNRFRYAFAPERGEIHVIIGYDE
jgi:hypothetical protein